MNKNLLILGAGMFGTVVREIAESTNCFEKIAFLDDSFGTDGFKKYHHEKTIIGKLDDYIAFMSEYDFAFVSIGNPEVRMKWTKKLIEAGYSIPSIISPHSFISPSAQLNIGVVVAPMAVINSNTCIGEGSFITAGSVIDHNSIIGDYCNVQCGTVVMPGARMPDFTKTQPNDVFRKSSLSYTFENLDGKTIVKEQPIKITTDGNIEG